VNAVSRRPQPVRLVGSLLCLLVMSLILVVMCILAWQAPYAPPAGELL